MMKIEGQHRGFTVRRSIESDAAVLAPNLRAQDVAEVHSMHSPEDALKMGVKLGDCYSVIVDGEIVGMFGRCVVVGGVLSIWMLASDAILKIRRQMVSMGRQFIDELIAGDSFGCNAVWIKNRGTRRWLEYIGAEFGQAMTIDGKKFLPFKIYRDNV